MTNGFCENGGGMDLMHSLDESIVEHLCCLCQAVLVRVFKPFGSWGNGFASGKPLQSQEAGDDVDSADEQYQVYRACSGCFGGGLRRTACLLSLQPR